MEKNEQKSFLEFSIQWEDEDILELSITASNISFYGNVKVYDSADSLLQFSRALLAAHPNDINLFHKSGEKGGDAYFSMRYFPIGYNGLIGVEINIESNVSTAHRPEGKDQLMLKITVEPNQIDRFGNELSQLMITKIGKATLYGRDND